MGQRCDSEEGKGRVQSSMLKEKYRFFLYDLKQCSLGFPLYKELKSTEYLIQIGIDIVLIQTVIFESYLRRTGQPLFPLTPKLRCANTEKSSKKINALFQEL